MNNVKIIILTFAIIFLTACGERKSFIFVIDLSNSVTQKAREHSFEAIYDSAAKLGRGDCLIIVPITGDAATQTGGNVIRVEASEIRKLRDRDLKEFQAEIIQKLEKMQQSNQIYPNTDLFGALRVANEIAKQQPQNVRVMMFVLSDLLNSTNEIRFEKDLLFEDAKKTREFAETKKLEWSKIEIYCGSLSSTDLEQMPPKRRENVGIFWQEYFKIGNAKRIQIATDGIGQIKDFIRQE
jgi:hypothetical protein